MTPEKIREARKDLNLTGEQFGRLLGFGVRAKVTISELERGKHHMSETAARLLRAYLAGYRPDDWPRSVPFPGRQPDAS